MAFGSNTDDFDLDAQLAQQLQDQQFAAQQVILQGVHDSQHAPDMTQQQQDPGLTVAEAMHRILQRFDQQAQINEQFKAAFKAQGPALAGGSSGLQLRLPHFYGKAGENVTT